MPRPPEIRLRGDRCMCPTCREYFNSTYAFDKHRIGVLGQKRCLTKLELQINGWNKKGDYWLSPRKPSETGPWHWQKRGRV